MQVLVLLGKIHFNLQTKSHFHWNKDMDENLKFVFEYSVFSSKIDLC